VQQHKQGRPLAAAAMMTKSVCENNNLVDGDDKLCNLLAQSTTSIWGLAKVVKSKRV
jgi:hypothetical protein